MIVQCEGCSTKFNLEESMLKSNGSRVRCFVCEHVFTVYPNESISTEEGGAPLTRDWDAEKDDSERMPPSLGLDEDEKEKKVAAEKQPASPVVEEKPSKSYPLTTVLLIILLLMTAAAAILFWAPDLVPDFLSFLKPGA